MARCRCLVLDHDDTVVEAQKPSTIPLLLKICSKRTLNG